MKLKVEENNYEINIGQNIDQELKDYLSKNKNRKIALISDEYVYFIYRNRLHNILCDFDYDIFTFPQGEKSKSMKTYSEILEFLSENDYSRGDVILAFGGGITGDLAGFVASTYLRGINFIAVPTTLLSMIDSSVGGKNGINFNGLKNQVGTFYFPEYVHIDYSFLDTLKKRDLNNGLAEMFKYSVLKDKNLFEILKNNEKLDYEYLIHRSLEIKIEFVKDDIRDKSIRQHLNLGHTIGHGIEGLSKYEINHGEAVGIGLIYVSRAAYKLGIASEPFYKDLIKEFKKYNLPTEYDFKTDEILEIMKHDKKIKDNKINLIIPTEIGNTISKTLSFNELKNIIELGKEI